MTEGSNGATCRGANSYIPFLFPQHAAAVLEEPLLRAKTATSAFMKPTGPSPETQVLMAGCVATTAHSAEDWHSYPFDKFCLISGGATAVGLAGKKQRLEDNTLFLVHQNENWGYWNVHEETPSLWTVFFKPGKKWYEPFPALAGRDPLKRVWKLSPDQSSTFKSLVVKIAAEHTAHRTASTIAESSWLRLLMVTVQRWTETGKSMDISPQIAEPDVLNLWQKLNEMVWQSGDTKCQLQLDLPNYDSLRHRFQRIFGISPQKLLMSMRMEHAKSLLLETALNVKEIAAKLGYARQHEFTRAFHKMVGASPSEWRSKFQTLLR